MPTGEQGKRNDEKRKDEKHNSPRKARAVMFYIKQQLDAFADCHQSAIPRGGRGCLDVFTVRIAPASCLSTFP